MQELLVQSGHPVLVALTKGDKLTRSAQATRAAALARPWACVRTRSS